MKHSHENRPLTHILKFNPNLDAEFYASVCLDWEKWFKAQKEELQQLIDTKIANYKAELEKADSDMWKEIHAQVAFELERLKNEILGVKK